jgi:CBS domain containing-hemolysin-like protein
MVLLVFYLALALGVSFLCSILEAVLLSLTPTYVMALEKEGSRTGKTLAALKEDIDRPLAAILTLNTVAHTVGAAGVGAQALRLIGDWAVALVSAGLTVLILVFSEIIPKTLGAVYWRALAPSTARLLPLLIRVSWPFVVMAQALTRALSSREREPTTSREELSALADVATQEGVVDSTESAFLKSLLAFDKLRAQDIMTPRTVMLAFEASTTAADVVADEANLRFSRLPVYRADTDHVTGYVLKHDVLLELARDRHDTPLDSLRRDIVVAPATVRVELLLRQLLEAREHIALLVDEYGGTAGIVTLEDVVEHLLGLQIVDETDAVQDMQAMARHRWSARSHRLGLTGRFASPVLHTARPGTAVPSEPAEPSGPRRHKGPSEDES